MYMLAPITLVERSDCGVDRSDWVWSQVKPQEVPYECTDGVKSEPFNVDIELRQGCVLSPLLFITVMHWSDMHDCCRNGIPICVCSVVQLISVDGMVLLSSSELSYT